MHFLKQVWGGFNHSISVLEADDEYEDDTYGNHVFKDTKTFSLFRSKPNQQKVLPTLDTLPEESNQQLPF